MILDRATCQIHLTGALRQFFPKDFGQLVSSIWGNSPWFSAHPKMGTGASKTRSQSPF